jgi:repressor LexA
MNGGQQADGTGAGTGTGAGVGGLVRQRREQLGLSLSELARRANVAVSYLSMIENHRLDKPPSRAVLGRLEAALQLRDGPLHAAADWATTPAGVRRRVAELEDAAERGQKLAAWLRSHTHTAGPHGGRDLDALYRSGQLAQRVNAVLPPETDLPPPGVVHSGSEGLAATADAAADAAATERDEQTADAAVQWSNIVRLARRVPLINKVAAGGPAAFTDLGFPAGAADDYLQVPGLDDPDAFATRVTGDSMSPAYREGDIVIFSPLAEVADGCDCFVRLEPDHEVTFKRVYFHEVEGQVRLQPLNPDHPPRLVPREQVAGLFRAVWRFAKL